MRLRNGPHGYGAVTKTLHWLTVALLIAQFAVGYLMDDSGGHGRGRTRGRGDGSGHGRGHRGGGSDFEGIDLLPVHVALGVAILLLAIARVAWRIGTELPPWDDRLTPFQRTLAHRAEKVLPASLFAIPLTGLGLVLSGEDDYLAVQMAAHLVFFAALAAHPGLVLRRRML